ncbi:hypothetical protein GCM10009706_30210 [Curtobacterium citreum]|nr:hypothetical protein GCM10009706_30210 [Curtobacterium citreum]
MQAVERSGEAGVHRVRTEDEADDHEEHDADHRPLDGATPGRTGWGHGQWGGHPDIRRQVPQETSKKRDDPGVRLVPAVS